MIDVDWSSLMPKHKQEPRAAGAALLRFTPGAVLLRAGISKQLAGPELLEQVREVCKRELEDPKGKTVFIYLFFTVGKHGPFLNGGSLPVISLD